MALALNLYAKPINRMWKWVGVGYFNVFELCTKDTESKIILQCIVQVKTMDRHLQPFEILMKLILLSWIQVIERHIPHSSVRNIRGECLKPSFLRCLKTRSVHTFNSAVSKRKWAIKMTINELIISLRASFLMTSSFGHFATLPQFSN